VRYTINVVSVLGDGVQAMTPAPVFRASENTAAACRSVSGQECFGVGATAQWVESVSGTGLAGAAGVLGLVTLGEGLLARHGYATELGQERPRPVTQRTGQPVLAQPDGVSTSGISTDDGNDDNSKGDNGSKPMSPWDFRTSSPPG